MTEERWKIIYELSVFMSIETRRTVSLTKAVGALLEALATQGWFKEPQNRALLLDELSKIQGGNDEAVHADSSPGTTAQPDP